MDRDCDYKILQSSSSDSELNTASLQDSLQASAPEQWIQSFGRYQNLEFLGKGGMANVYKAYDPSLDRIVALKFVRVESPELTERLMREARAQAKIDHDHVCKVYEVGQIEGKNYIAMQYIPGLTLKEASKSMSMKEKIEILAQVAEAVHAAHRNGLIHRDLKPSNIMIVSDERSAHPYVMDFGLAREIEAEGITVSGAVIGTPAYMSPEQASGKHLDHRTDVYSIGTTLYEVLTDRPAFHGNSGMEVLMNVIQKEPEPPCSLNPSIPIDLETIILKSMEKEPQRRYDSSLSFAEDLRRYLDGLPVHALRQTWKYRSVKRIRKHPVTSALLAVALVVVISALSFAVYTRWRAADQTKYANEFNIEIQEIQQRLRYFYSQPAHDIRKEEQSLRSRLETIERNLRHMRSAAQGPGKYAIGVGYLALGENQKAKSFLEQAWNHEQYKVSASSFAYGLSLVNLYEKELKETELIANQNQRAARIKQVEKELRDPALKLLAQGRSATETPLYAEAVVALLENRYEDALKKADDALTQMPWLYEAERLKGDAYSSLAQRSQTKGAVQEAIELYNKAQAAYQQAISKAPSDVKSYGGLAALQNKKIRFMNMQAANFPHDPFEIAIKACETAKKIRPDLSEVYKWYGRTFIIQGQRLYRKGFEYKDEIAKGIENLEKARTLDPTDPYMYYSLGNAYRTAATYAKEHGQDPVEKFNKALSALRKGTELAPHASYILTYMGSTYTFLAQYQLDHGMDAVNSVDQAISSYKKSLAINPADTETLGIICITYSQRAQLEAEHGRDPRPFFELAFQSAKQSIKLNPQLLDTYNYLGAGLYWKAEYELNHGLDPVPSINEALQAYQSILNIKEDTDGYGNTCEALNLKAEYLLLTGASAREPAEKAIENCQKAVKAAPDLDFYGANLSIAYANLAEAEIANSSTFKEAVHKSKEEVQRALKINPRYPELHFTLGRLEFLSALNNADPHAFARARTHFAKALEMNPKYDAAQWLTAESHRLEGEAKFKRGLDPSKEIGEGLKICEQADPRDSHLLAAKSALLSLKARSSSESREQALEQSKQSLDEALRLNANLKSRYTN